MQILATTKKRNDLNKTKAEFIQKKIDVNISKAGHQIMDVKKHIVDKMTNVQHSYDKCKDMKTNDDFSKLSESLAMFNSNVILIQTAKVGLQNKAPNYQIPLNQAFPPSNQSGVPPPSTFPNNIPPPTVPNNFSAQNQNPYPNKNYYQGAQPNMNLNANVTQDSNLNMNAFPNTSVQGNNQARDMLQPQGIPSYIANSKNN